MREKIFLQNNVNQWIKTTEKVADKMQLVSTTTLDFMQLVFIDEKNVFYVFFFLKNMFLMFFYFSNTFYFINMGVHSFLYSNKGGVT